MAANSAVQSPADVVNLALRRIGYQMRVASLYDGSKAANNALDIYAQTRDALLRDGDWDFAERNTTLNLLKQAPPGGYFPPTVWSPAYPPLPWIYEYAYPNDCLKVRAVKGVPLFIPNFDPQPNVFDTPNDNALTPAARVIVCNVPSAVLTYTGQVTDPTAWEATFVEEMATGLGQRLGPVLKDLDVARLEAADAAQSTQIAKSNQG